jgi:CxxC motif-containing protein (DUF1111 family)
VKGQRVIGRFGLKARIATLDDFCADAFQDEMGTTSPLRPDVPFDGTRRRFRSIQRVLPEEFLKEPST